MRASRSYVCRGVSWYQSWDRWPNSVPMRAARARRCRQGTMPSTSASPSVGWRMPVSILIDVDLPAPLGPMYASRSPRSTAKLMPATASTGSPRRGWNVFRSRRASIAIMRHRSKRMTGYHAAMVSEQDVRAALVGVIDPEIRRSVVELDMVRAVAIDGGAVGVTIALTVAGCPMKANLEQQVRTAVGG